jgi:ribonuclease G
MAQEILINAGAAEIRIAAVEDGRLQALAGETTLDAGEGGLHRGASRVGDIVLGRVTRVVPAIQAAFVEIGMARAGFLGVREARVLLPRDAETEPVIGDVVREGDALAVQIVKDTIGEKGARLSASPAVPGRLLVLTPMQHSVALSRRIVDEAERVRLAALGERLLAGDGEGPAETCGFIFRTNAFGASFEEIREEAEALCGLWRDIAEARALASPPAVLYRDAGPVECAMRDMTRLDTARILIDDPAALEAARAYARAAAPALEARIEHYTGPGALFDMYDIEADLERLAHPRVPLACGGWITIETTEALTAVDVNSGSFTRASGIADLSLAVNLEAARELGRQVRLRGVGGVIVVDFIHMSGDGHAAQVLAELEHSLTRDGRPVVIAPVSPFGLVEITRKRVREPRGILFGEPCRACSGTGRVRKISVTALDLIRRIEAAARAAPGAYIRAEAAPEVIGWIEAQGEPLQAALAARGAARVEYVADETRLRETFDVGTV